MSVLQDDLLVFRSDPPLSKVFRPVDQKPSAHQPFYCHNLDPNVTGALSNTDCDDHATLAEVLKGKMGGVEFEKRSESPEQDAATSCPKRQRTTVRKRRVVLPPGK